MKLLHPKKKPLKGAKKTNYNQDVNLKKSKFRKHINGNALKKQSIEKQVKSTQDPKQVNKTAETILPAVTHERNLLVSSSCAEEKLALTTPTTPSTPSTDEHSSLPDDHDDDDLPGTTSKADPYFLQDTEICKTLLSDNRWTNKQRVLVFCGRGVTHRHRHLMEDIKRLLPHSKAEPKWEKKEALNEINEVCEMQSCNSCLYFETRKSSELYMWLARVPHGPSIKFQVLNVHTLGELKLSGNCLLHSRPLLIFDKAFDDHLHLKLMKELFTQIFGTPRNHPRSKPFFDHVMSFFYCDSKIWFRHYQIAPMTGKDANKPLRQLLTEIGPRFVLDPIKILDGSFSGCTIYQNPHYVTPTALRLMASRGFGSKYAARKASKHQYQVLRESLKMGKDALDPANIFLPTVQAVNSESD